MHNRNTDKPTAINNRTKQKNKLRPTEIQIQERKTKGKTHINIQKEDNASRNTEMPNKELNKWTKQIKNNIERKKHITKPRQKQRHTLKEKYNEQRTTQTKRTKHTTHKNKEKEQTQRKHNTETYKETETDNETEKENE